MKKGILLLKLLLSLFMLSGCMNIPTTKNVYDQPEEIIKQGDSYSYRSRLGTVTETKASLDFRDFVGMETLFVIKDATSMTIDCQMRVSKGRFKVVLIDGDGDMIEINDEMTLVLFDDIYRIKIVGDEAYGMMDLVITTSEMLPIATD